MRVYLAGPMSGYANYNFPAFDAKTLELRAFGFTVISPADIDRGHGFDGTQEADPEFVRRIILEDLEALETCDAVFLLPGADRSKGAAVEVAAAQYWGIPVIRELAMLLALRERVA